ncbi:MULTISPECIES: hypothetical protein [Candidatus Ichthyocystis]|uniref:Putative membrane protein n=1 Tax=Candidatus Ichthyocystis hellenicum TaxID=1561003 RepID=A0A0S4M420_9BURK|nr:MULTISPECIES: hypothetical protein [Ichthyocystis]CUT17968.1 putative membrane protein [Candidatus Ichthyocystis hellenicum]
MINGNFFCRLCCIPSPRCKLDKVLGEVSCIYDYKIISISDRGFSFKKFKGNFFDTGDSTLSRRVLQSIILGNAEKVISDNRTMGSRHCNPDNGVVSLYIKPPEWSHCSAIKLEESFIHCWDCNSKMYKSFICPTIPYSISTENIKINASCSTCCLDSFDRYKFIGSFVDIGSGSIFMISCSSGKSVFIPSFSASFFSEGMTKCDSLNKGDVLLCCERSSGSKFISCKDCVLDMSLKLGIDRSSVDADSLFPVTIDVADDFSSSDLVSGMESNYELVPVDDESARGARYSRYFCLIGIAIMFLYLMALLIFAIWVSVNPSFLSRI